MSYSSRLAQSILLPVNTRAAHLLPLPRDALGDDPWPSDQYILQHFQRFVTPQISNITVDDALTPPVVQVSGSGFGSRRGTAQFNGAPASIPQWDDKAIAATLPRMEKGVLQFTSPDGMELEIRIDFETYRPAPGVTVSNTTGSNIAVEFNPRGAGGLVRLDVPARGTRSTRILPGAYTVDIRSQAGGLVDASSSQVDTYERGQAYTLRIDETMLAIGHLGVVNLTGANIEVSVGGRRLSVPPGGSNEIELPMGTHSVTFSTRCGAETRAMSIQPGVTERVTYSCVAR
jgi:hypothetical protein